MKGSVMERECIYPSRGSCQSLIFDASISHRERYCISGCLYEYFSLRLCIFVATVQIVPALNLQNKA